METPYVAVDSGRSDFTNMDHSELFVTASRNGINTTKKVGDARDSHSLVRSLYFLASFKVLLFGESGRR